MVANVIRASSARKSASFIGLADVGLGPQHVDLDAGGLTCDQLIVDSVKDATATGNALDLTDNGLFISLVTGVPSIATSYSVDVMPMLRNVQDAREQRVLTEALYYLLLGLAPNIHYLIWVLCFKTQLRMSR